MSYRRPIATHRTITIVEKSRFICTINQVGSPAEARASLAQIRDEMSDASHHVYAFRVGYGNSVIEGMSDDGEPSGTAGAPVLAVLRGTEIGDIIAVVSRYFGGVKLGTGGLVRAYTEATQHGIATLATEHRVIKKTLNIEISYPFYEKVKWLIHEHNSSIEDQTFGLQVTIIANIPADNFDDFKRRLSDITGGRAKSILLD